MSTNQLPVVDVLEGIRSRQLNIVAEGTGDGRAVMTLFAVGNQPDPEKAPRLSSSRPRLRAASPANLEVWEEAAGVDAAVGVAAVVRGMGGRGGDGRNGDTGRWRYGPRAEADERRHDACPR